MSMKRAQVEYQIEGSLEVMVPMGASLAEVERIAAAEVRRHAGALAIDLTHWNVTDVEEDQG